MRRPFIAVLVTGWLLGGTVGIGTLVYALSIGPLAHVFIPLLCRTRMSTKAKRPYRTARRGFPGVATAPKLQARTPCSR